MFQLQNTFQLMSSDSITSQTGVKLWGLLLPEDIVIKEENFNAIKYDEFIKAATIVELFEKAILINLSSVNLKDHVLIINAGSNFFNTDQVALHQIQNIENGWRIYMNITHIINPNAEPIPCRLYLFFNFSDEKNILKNMVLQLEENWQSFDGKIISSRKTLSTITIKLDQ